MIINFGLRKNLGSVQYPNFSLPLNDAGSGAVNTTPSRGTGSATFTRAGATATTVLSTGLVSSAIAANTARSYYDPAPTGGTGSYMYLPGVSGAYASTPDSSPVSVTGDIDVRVQVLLPDWTPTSNQMLISKANSVGNQFAYDFFCDTNGFLNFRTSPDGTTGGSLQTATSSVATGITDGTAKWVRATRSSTTGTVTFYTGDDGSSWTQLGSTQPTTVGGIFDSNTVLAVGIQANGTSNQTTGRIFRAQIYNGINGTLVADFDPTRTTQASTSFSASTGETWTINGLGRIYAAPVYLGYLAEEARTNLCLQSADLTTTWTVFAATISTNAITAPDGTVSADKIQEDNSTNVHACIQSITKAASSITYAASIFLKAAERTWAFIQIDDGTGANAARGWFNLSTGVVGSTTTVGAGFTAVSVSIQPHPNGFYRCTLVGTTNTATTVRIFGCPSTADTTASYLGTTGSGIYAWGGQLEVGSFSTSYIPTAAATSTRAADAMSFASAGNATTAQGSMFAKVTPLYIGGTQYASAISDGTNSNVVQMITTASCRMQTNSGGVTQADVSVAGVVVNVEQRQAAVWASNISNSYRNGTPGTLDTSVTVPASFTVIIIGLRGDGASPLNGCIRDFRIWQRVLSDSQIASIK